MGWLRAAHHLTEPQSARERALRIAPIFVAVVVALLLAPVGDTPVNGAPFVVAVALIAMAFALEILIPWQRLPRDLRRAVPALLGIAAVGFLRAAEGGAASEYGPLVVLPLVLLAMFGTPRELFAGLAAVAAVFVLPILISGAPDYPPSEWRRAIVWVMVAAAIGFLINRLVDRIATGRELAEHRAELLERAEQSFSRVIETTPIGMVWISLDGEVTQTNRAFASMMEYSPETLIGLNVIEMTPPADRALDRKTMEGMAAGEFDSYTTKRRYLTARGNVVWGVVNATLVRGESGEPLELLAQVQDVTPLQTAQEDAELAASNVETVVRATRALADPGAAAPVAQIICDAAIEISGAEVAAFWEPIEDAGMIEIRGSSQSNIRGQQIRTGSEPSGASWAYLNRKRLFVPDAADSELVSKRLVETTGVTSCLFEPAISGGTCVGVLCVCWKDPIEELSPRMSGLLELLAGEAATAVERQMAFARLADLAETDQLTGLANRRAWDRMLPIELERARRSKDPICVAIFDMDEFKDYNDSHGHQAGDRLLRAAASAWGQCLRAGDMLSRYGGEEFALLLPGCSIDAAEELGQRIRRATPTDQSCSVGLAEWNRSETAEELVRRADRALYAAKGAGKNRVVAT